MQRTILVTGAAGKTGRAVIRALVARGQAVRALVRRPDQAATARQLGARDVMAGDLREARTLKQAMEGARAVYHICPNVHPDEIAIGKAAIAASREAGVEHFVYHSVLHPQTEAMPHHWLKLRVEEHLLEAGIACTILQPAAYMQNLLAHWKQIVEEGVLPVPYPAETRLSLVDLDDVAEAAAIVLTEPGHVGAVYELAGPSAPSQAEIAGLLAEHLKRPVQVECTPLDQWEHRARSLGMGEYQVATLVKMFAYYAQHHFLGNPRVLGWLLGRSPATFEAFVRGHAS